MSKQMSKKLIYLAKGLRKRLTNAERLLWSRLRAGHFGGIKFRRQQPIGDYIVDFVSLERKLIVELDGGQHALADGMLGDKQRDAWLMKEGYTVLRFWDNEVFENIDGVIETIRRSVYEPPSP